MAHNTTVALGAHFQDFAADLVKEGRYGSVSEAVRAGLRLLEEREEQLKLLRQAVQDGLDSGVDKDFNFDDFRQRMREKHGAQG